MKRRDLFKTGLLLSVLGITSNLCGCNDTRIVKDNKETDIVPKQTKVYEFSAPIPYDFETIEGFIKLNEKYKKSKFVTLYNNIQRPCIRTFNEWLQVGDGVTPSVRTIDEFLKFANHATSLGLNVAYLLNSPKPYSQEDFNVFKDDLYRLLEKLANAGIMNIKVGSTQTATIVNEFNPDFKLSTSTAMEFHDISQYVNFIKNYPNVTLIDVAIDENHNFTFLRNLRKLFPNIDIEVMVNEPCIKGCPARSIHVAAIKQNPFNCQKLRESRPIYYAMRSPAIYPWNLEYYSAIGINNFKFVIGKMGRGEYRELDNVDKYMACVEHGIDNYAAKDLFEDVIRESIKIKDDIKISQIIDYLPDIRQFVKNGDKCASRCGVECNYCERIAEKLDALLKQINV